MAAIKKLLREHTKSENSLQDLYEKSGSSNFSENAYQPALNTPSTEVPSLFRSIFDAHTKSEQKMDDIYAQRNAGQSEYRINPVSYYADPLRKEVNSYLQNVNTFSGYSPATIASLRSTAADQLTGLRGAQGLQDLTGTNLRRTGDELAQKIKDNRGIDEATRKSLLRSLSSGTDYLDDLKINNIVSRNGSNLIPEYPTQAESGASLAGNHGGGASFAPEALTGQDALNSAANERLNQAAEDLNYKVNPGQMGTNERLQRISEIQLELQGLRPFENIQPGSMRGADAATVQRAMDAQSRIKSLNEELDALQSGYSYRPSEYSRLAEAATEAQKNINAYMADSQTRNRITANSGDYQAKEGQDLLENAKILANEGRIKEALDYYNQYNNQQARTKFGANYTSGRIGQDESLAWNEYLNHPSDANRRYAETLSALSEQYQTNNAEMMKKNDSIASLITEDLARYVPQFVDQMKYEALPMLFGAMVGGDKGMKLGRLIGSAAYSWETMSGAAFKNLLDRGVDEETARTACRNEAFLSTIIECADEVVDMFTTGFGKVSSQLFGTPVKGFDAVLEKFVGNSTWKKWAVRLGKFGLNVGSEANEEGSQEAISIANERLMAQGKDVSLTELALEAIKVYFDAIFNRDSENRERIGEAAAGGARLALVNMPMESAGNAALSSGINQVSGRQIRTSGAMQDVIEEGFYNNEDSRAYQLAQELQNMQNQPAGNRLQEIARHMVMDNRLGQLSAENSMAAAADAEANQLVYAAADKAMAGQEITNNDVAAILENDLAVEELEQVSGQEISTLRRGERPNAVRSALNAVAESAETAAEIDQNRSMAPYSAVTGRTGENTNLSLTPSLNKIAMSEQGRQLNASLRTEANPTLSSISASMVEREANQDRQANQKTFWEDAEARKENIRKRIDENRKMSPEAWDNDLERMYDESNPNWSNNQLIGYSENLGLHGAGAYVSNWRNNQDISQYTKEFTQYYNAGRNGNNINTVGDISKQILTQDQRVQAYITGIRDTRTEAVKEAVEEYENESEGRTETVSDRSGRDAGLGTDEQGSRRYFWKDQAQQRSRKQREYAERIREQVREEGLKPTSAASLGIPNGTENETMTIIPEDSPLYTEDMRERANRMKAMGTEVRYFVGKMEFYGKSTNSKGETITTTFPANGIHLQDQKLIYVQLDNTDKYVNLDYEQILKHEEYHMLKKLYPKIQNDVRANVNKMYDQAEFQDLQWQYKRFYGYDLDESPEEIYADAYAGIDRIAPEAWEYKSTTEYADTVQEIGREYADRALRETAESDESIESTESKTSRNAVDSEGRNLSAAQQEYFKDSKIRDAAGNLMTMYHGTDADFNVFNFDRGGEHGTAEGFGIYLTNDRETAESYGGRIIESYANITRPARSDRKTIKLSEMKKLIKAANEYDAEKLMADGYDSLNDAVKDAFVSNYTYTYDKSMAAAYDEVARDILRLNDNDMDIVQEIIAGMGIRTYAAAQPFYDLLTKTTGIDGFVTNWKRQDGSEGPTVALAFNSNQVKNIDNTEPTESPDIRFSRVSNPETLEWLNKQDTVKVYRAMQVIDGKLYPPMAAKVSGKLVEPTEFGKWYVADESNREENPERFIKKKRKDGTIYYNFRLNKANGKEIDAAYNPYWHTSKSLLNDQFSSAYNRPNLVTVECEVPASELTSGYRAEGAKDPVGIVHWHTGPVSSKLAEVGRERIVILSRYVKVNRIVSDAEAAQSIKEMLEGTSITIPENTVTPSLKKELEAVGVTITPPKITIKALKDFSPKDSYIRSDDYKKTLKAFQGAWGKIDKLSDRISDLKEQIEAESELKDRADWTEEDEYDSYMGKRPRTYTKVGKRLQKKLDGLEEQKRSLLHQRDELSDKLQGIKADARREEFKTFDAPKKATRTDYEGFRLDNTSNSFGNDYLTNGKGYIAEMTPQEYIERCAFEIFDTGTIESTINGTDPELVQKYADMMMDGTKVDLPYLNYKDGGQEGRHRALAAYQAEIDTIPVLIIGEHRNGVPENEIELDLDSDDIDIEDLLDDVNEKELLDEQDEVDNIIADRKVENGEGLTPSEEVRYSLNHDADFVEKERAFKQNFVNDNVLTASFAQREFVRNKLMQPGIRELLPEDKMGKTSFGNGSYGRSMEHSTICPRTLSMEAILDGLSERFGRPITVDESIKISQLAWAYMDAPECAYCYVAMDRKAKREYLLNYLTSRNEVFKNIDSGMSREEAYNVFLNGRKDTKPMKDRFNNWIRMRENGSEMIEMKDLASDRAIKAASEKSKSMADQVRDALKYAQSASWAKKYVQYTAYNGEILKWSPKLVNSLNRMYGMRMYSFSDFHPAFTLEDMQMITDASLRGLKVLAYTKEIDFARIMEPTGANINVSVFAQSTKDTKGDYGMDAMQGADWDEAKALRAESIRNGTGVGITMVCTNDDQIEWALNQDWIDVVIPFHMVKTGDVVRKSFGWDNYTDMQGDKKLKDLWDGKVNEAMIEPPEHQNNKRLYLEALKRNNLSPRFERWIDNPNYMKLVNETRRAEGETPTVQPKFNLDAADAMFDKMQKQGGYYQHLGLETDVFEDLQDEIYDEYVEKYGAPTKYSRNSRISPDAQREISQQKMDLEQKLMDMDEALRLAKKENERLQGELTKAQREMTITKEKKALEGSVKRAASALMKEYDIYPGDKGKYNELHYQISKNLEQMRNVVLNITDPEVYEKNLRLYALKMTDDMIKGMQRLVSADEQTYSSMKEYLKATKIRLSEQDKPDMKDFDKFRKRNMGRLKLTNDGLPVDTVYQEMREEFGSAYFPEDITHPADQLYRIEEIMQTLEPVYEGYTSLEMAEMKEYIASDIENRIIDIVTSDAIKAAPPTLADKMKAKYEAKLKETESSYQKRLEEMGAANLEKINKILDKEKDSRSEMTEKISSYYSEQNAARRARRADSDARTRLLKIARRLSNKKLPTPNKALIQQYIADLDLTAKSMTRTTFDKLSDLKMWYDTEKATNPDFISDPQTEAKLRRLSQWRISELSIDEVRDLTNVLLNIENEIRTQRYLIEAADKRDIYIQGEETIRNISNTEGIKAGILGKLDSLFVNGTLSPVRAMHRMTGYNEEDPLYRATKELADGQRKMFDFQMRADKMFSTWTEDKAFVREISGKNAKLIEVLPGVVITPDMRMSLYLHSKNDENLRHVAKGGITIPDMKLYRKGDIAEAYNRGKTVKLQRSQVEDIIKGMSEKEKAFADQASKYFGDMSQKAINETSELLKGYSLAEVTNYFPINTDRNFTRADFETLKMDGTIEGMGFLKERLQASNPIYLRDMSDVLRQSIEMTGKYVGLAIPVRNFNKIWNVATGEKNPEGKFISFFDGSVKKEISQKWGDPGLKYIEQMMTDLQNGKKSVNDWSKVLGKVRSHYAQAVLTLNASVAMKQAASYPTAGAVLGWKPLLRALADFGPVNTEKINKYTPLLWYRTQGFSTQELGDMKQRGMQLPKALNWVQGMDVLTTRKLWKASEYYVKSNNKDLKVGSEEYYQAVADIYNRVIEETQPNYTTMQRPQLLRQDDTLLSAMMMFKTQPFQNFNILYDAIGNLAAKEQQYKLNTNAKTEAAVKQARRDAANAITSQVAQLAVFAGMTFAWAMFRGKGDKYKDEEGNQTFLTTAAGIGKDMIGNLFSSIPFGADAWEYISSKLFGDRYYGFDIATASSIDDLLSAFTKAGDAVKEIFGAMTSDDKKLSDVDWNEQRLNMTSVLNAVGKIAGVPIENVGKLFEAIFRNAAHLAAGKYDGEYAYLRLTESESKHKADYTNLLWKAYKNDPEAYRRLYEKMVNLDGLNEAKIKSAMEAKMKKDQGAESVSDLDHRFMAPDAEAEYSTMLKPIMDSKLWGQNEKADEKLENKLYQLATGTEAGMKIQQKMEEYSNEGIDNTTYLLYQLALDIADGQGDGNGSYNNAEKEAAIRMLGLPKKKSYDLWEAQSNAKTDKANPWK